MIGSAQVKLARLRAGELIAGAGGLALLTFMFLLPWYGTAGKPASRATTYAVDGWHGLTHLRWLMLATIVLSLGLVIAQATRRAPALPATISVILTVLGATCALLLAYRVLVNPPGTGTAQRSGAFLGLFSAIAISYGAYRSLRQEGVSPGDGPQRIERIVVGDRGFTPSPEEEYRIGR
ncbi:MAG: hypothetical protein ACR2IP_10060 [Solirubrobacteraceae bacterium]